MSNKLCHEKFFKLFLKIACKVNLCVVLYLQRAKGQQPEGVKMLDRYEITVKLIGGSVHNFNNTDGTECNVGDVIQMSTKAHSYENALKTIKHTLSICHVKYEIL